MDEMFDYGPINLDVIDVHSLLGLTVSGIYNCFAKEGLSELHISNFFEGENREKHSG